MDSSARRSSACLNCNKQGYSFQICGRCKNPRASYCSKNCQVSHWASHKTQCITESKQNNNNNSSSNINEDSTTSELSSMLSDMRIPSDRSTKKRREVANGKEESQKDKEEKKDDSFTKSFENTFPSKFHFSPDIKTKSSGRSPVKEITKTTKKEVSVVPNSPNNSKDETATKTSETTSTSSTSAFQFAPPEPLQTSELNISEPPPSLSASPAKNDTPVTSPLTSPTKSTE